MSDTVNLDFLARQIDRVLTEQREMRGELAGMREDMTVMSREIADMRRATLQLIEKSIRHERRFDELEHRIVETKDDMELMIRSELMGRMAHFESKMEARFSEGFSEPEQPLLTP